MCVCVCVCVCCVPRAAKTYYVSCAVGMRGYLATRQLQLAGKDAVNITGGYRSYAQLKADQAAAAAAPQQPANKL